MTEAGAQPPERGGIDRPTLSVVIPAYNEQTAIGEVLERLLSTKPALEEAGLAGLEVIVVDDGSCDQTTAVVSGWPQVRLLCHDCNRGYGAAIKTG